MPIISPKWNACRKALGDAGVTTSLEARDAAPNLTEELKNVIESSLGELRALVLKQGLATASVSSGAALQLGRGYMATAQYQLASEYLGEYLASNSADWEAQFARGIALANLRGGRSTDLAASGAITRRSPSRWSQGVGLKR